jgi:cytochrome b561
MAYRGNTLKIHTVTGGLYTSHVDRRHDPGGRSAGLSADARTPVDEPTIEPWQKVASHLNHWGIYVLLLCVPVAGYVGISLFPALDIFGLFSLPGVVAPNREASATAFLVHRLLGRLLVLMVAIHVAAALFHYFIRKDNARMLPSLLRR